MKYKTRLLGFLLPWVFATGCVYEAPAAFAETVTLGGENIGADALNRGRDGYGKYCLACHGAQGDGRGPASPGLATPPRDFRLATYKFTGTVPGYLPHDEDLASVVQIGLNGTAMLQWDVPDAVLHDILQYIKTFSPEGSGWRDPDMEKGERIVPGDDPWGEAKTQQAIERGKAVYHGIATCYLCHPAYQTAEQINRHRKTFELPPSATFRDRLWLPDPKSSSSYSKPVANDPTCSSNSDCGADSQICQLGRCEEKGWLMPPDFLLNSVRTGNTPQELYRVIAAGIPGTAMPTWTGVLTREDIWAMGYFIRHLTELKGTEEGATLRRQVRLDSLQQSRSQQEPNSEESKE